MHRPEAVFLDTATVDRGDLDFSSLRRLPLDWRFFPQTGAGAVEARAREAEIIVTNKVPVGGDVQRRLPRLRLICVAATGTNVVDLEAARDLGLPVTNVTGYATPAVVQHVFALALALTTRLAEYREAIAAGGWQRAGQFCMLDFPVRELAGKRLGIIGYGELGRGVARVAEAFGMEVLIADRPGGPHRTGRLPMDELLPAVDVLSIHCPLTPETANLIGPAELGKMKPDALLINTARGGIVDEAALADALRGGLIGGAGVDVLSQEPPVDGNPLLAPEIPNLLLTPHTAWASVEARQRLLDEVALNIGEHLAGGSRNRVN
jgi:glycerate dehydrogenase